MGKRKLEKFEAINTFPNVYQNTSWHQPNCTDYHGTHVEIKGNWQKLVFKNKNPLVVELACGKGDYTLALAQLFPKINFLGIDLKGNRIWKGALQAQELSLMNVHFFRTRIELLAHFFDAQEIDEIWITFPDPHLKKIRAQNRLTSHRFLNIYKPLLKSDGIIHLKTDSLPLYEFTKETIKSLNLNLITDINNVYENEPTDKRLNIQTYYEKKHLANGLAIKYLKFSFN